MAGVLDRKGICRPLPLIFSSSFVGCFSFWLFGIFFPRSYVQFLCLNVVRNKTETEKYTKQIPKILKDMWAPSPKPWTYKPLRARSCTVWRITITEYPESDPQESWSPGPAQTPQKSHSVPETFSKHSWSSCSLGAVIIPWEACSVPNHTPLLISNLLYLNVLILVFKRH